MNLIRRTARQVLKHANYNGVCHACGTPVQIDGFFLAILIEETETEFRVVPIDVYECPHCGAIMKVMRIYKSLEVHREFAAL